MKLYPSKHRVYFRKQVTPEMIPLSYVYNDDKDWNVDVQIEPVFGRPAIKTRACPYQVFDSNEIFLFDEAGVPVSDPTKYLQRIGSRWRLLPANVTDFVPKTFDFTVTVKKEGTYTKESRYRFNLGFLFTEEALQNKLFSLLQNPKQTKQYPSNIVFNGGETMQSTFMNRSEDNCDILFCTLEELNERASGHTLAQEIDAILSEHKNLWIIDDDFDGNVFETSANTEYGQYKLDYNDIYADNGGILEQYKTDDGQYVRFKAGAYWSVLDPAIYQEVPFFKEGTPVQLLHSPDKGYVVLSHTALLSKINTNAEGQAQVRLFFELLSYVCLHGYFACGKQNVFITDEPVDYYINTTQRYYLSHPRLNLDRILQEAGFNIQTPYQINDVEISIPAAEIGNYAVEYTGTNRFNDLIFKKIAGRTKDPAKGNNVLIYTADKTMLLCDIREIALDIIETGITIRQEDAYTLAISPIKSTAYRIYTENEVFVSFTNAGAAAGDLVYSLYYDRNSYTNHAIPPFRIVLSGETGTNLVKLATIIISVNRNMEFKDVRQPGGGEASAIPNYEMIDTGNRYGRPYRYGGPMIIELPERFRPMNDQIRSEVDKHIASGDYPIILYKD